ncbi:TetR/AcrR family transcriptional regulator [Microbacterium testaceum]|uniref:TetR/AcrR family transcriptional regulator n=1 Tax=Microbacterium testaceum TaxID=2033 RepID=UPI00341DFB58
MTTRPRSTVGGEAPMARRVGRPAGPTAQGAASREAIVDAAAGVFARLGYERARMADIIEVSGLSKGSVYFHFDSKEALAVAVLEERHARWIADIERILVDTRPGELRIQRLLPAMLSLHRDDPDAWVISRLAQSLAEVESTRAVAASMTRRWIDLVADLIQEAEASRPMVDGADGYSRVTEWTSMATLLVGAFDGLKATVNVVSSGDEAAAQRRLAEGGALLERMLMRSLGLVG